MNVVAPKDGAKHELLFYKWACLRGKFVEQKLMLSCSFRRDQIHTNHSYELGHTLLCCLNLLRCLQPGRYCFWRGARYITGENLDVVRAEFSILS
jgi:hypothetical protein